MADENARSWRYWPTTGFLLVAFGAFEVSFVVQGISDVREAAHHGSWIGPLIFWVLLAGVGAVVLARIAMSSLALNDENIVIVNLFRTMRVNAADVSSVEVVDRGRRLRSVALHLGGGRQIVCDGLTSLVWGRKGAEAMFAGVADIANRHINAARAGRT